MKPVVVGITMGTPDRDPEHRALRADYIRAVERGGGVAVILTAGAPTAAAALVDRVDALVLSGGGDIDPALYGESPLPGLGRVERERDHFELALAHAALGRDLPLLAICRGHQLLNVALGGSLTQDLPSQLGRTAHEGRGGRTEVAHQVDVRPGTLLARVVPQSRIAVNSFHHQAVERLGAGAVASGVDPDDGTVEALEVPGRRFVLGVQWHPESYWAEASSPSQALFSALVDCAAARTLR